MHMPMHAGNSEYTDFMRFMNQSENSQQSITAWNEFTGETTEEGAVATASTSAQDADWIRDFEDHKVQQGKIGFLNVMSTFLSLLMDVFFFQI